MSNFTIYHNPRCSKSRATMALLEERGIEPTVVLYLEDPPSAEAIKGLLGRLGMTPRQLMRTGEAQYAELNLDAVEDDGQLVAAMAGHPILIERPIVDDGVRAVLGRPPENVLELL